MSAKKDINDTRKPYLWCRAIGYLAMLMNFGFDFKYAETLLVYLKEELRATTSM